MAEIPEKNFYKVGEVCQYTDTQPYVLRFWESEFPQLAPQKNRSGQRIYTRDDIELILKIKDLLYAEEYTIAGARQRLEQDLSGGRKRRAPKNREPTAPAVISRKPARAAVPRADRAPEARAADADELDLSQTRRELQTLRRRVAELDERWRRAEQALQESEEARNAERETRHRIAHRLETVLKAIGVLQQGPGAE